MTRPKRCVDCVAEGITTNRKPALWKGKPVPGSRCSTHHRARRGQTRDLSWERRLIQTYGITAEEYWQIYEFQQGRCYICGRGKGARKRLAVDHDHATGMVRGLLDQPCNRNILGHLRDDPEALQRAIEYLKNPPAVQVLGERIAPIEALRLTSNGSEDA